MRREMTSWFLRFRVLLLRELRRPSFYLVAGLVLVLQIYLGSVALPSASNRAIGIVSEGKWGGKVLETLLAAEGNWRWEAFPEEESLMDAVASGSVDSGFVFGNAFEEALRTYEEAPAEAAMPDLAGCVEYVSSTSTTKGDAAKETVYACVLKTISPAVLRQAVASGQVLEDGSEAAQKAVLDELAVTTDSDMLFDVHFEVYGEIGAETGQAADESGVAGEANEGGPAAAGETGSGSAADEAGERGPASAVAGILLFAAALLFATARYRTESGAVMQYFRREGFLYQVLEVLAPLLLTAIPVVVVLLVQRSTGPLQVILLVPVLCGAAVWAAGLVRLFRSEVVYLFFAVALVAMAAVLSVEIGDLLLLRSVRWARYLLPASWMMGVL